MRSDFERAIKTASEKKMKDRPMQRDESPTEALFHKPVIETETTWIDQSPGSIMTQYVPLVGRVLENVPLLRRRHLRGGLVGLEWTCKCGHSDTDLYRERAPGGVKELANKLLHGSGVIRANATTTSKSRVSSFFEISRNTALRIYRGFQQWI